MPSTNEDLADEYTVFAVNLERYKVSVRRDVLKVLRAMENDIVKRLAKLDPTAVSTGRQRKRLDNLLKQVRETIETRHKQARQALEGGYRELAKVEDGHTRKALAAAVGVPVGNTALTPDQLKAIAGKVLIEGAPSREWWARQSRETLRRFTDAMRLGLSQGETLGDLVRRVRGSKKANYNDGIMALSYRNAEAIVRTSVQAVANQARIDSFSNNADVIKAVQQRSTLDGRTTDICKAYSGLQWSVPDYEPLGHSLPFNGGPPRHWNCRSTLVPVTRSWSELAQRKIRTPAGGTVKGANKYFERQLAAKGLSPEAIARAKRNAQASMDGQVPEDWNYEAWLKRKPVEFQKEILGQAKYDLWKRGKLTFKDLVDQSGRPLSVDELRAKFS